MEIYKGHFVKSNKKKWDRSLESDVQLEPWQDPATWKLNIVALNVNVTETVIRDRIRRKYYDFNWECTSNRRTGLNVFQTSADEYDLGPDNVQFN